MRQCCVIENDDMHVDVTDFKQLDLWCQNHICHPHAVISSFRVLEVLQENTGCGDCAVTRLVVAGNDTRLRAALRQFDVAHSAALLLRQGSALRQCRHD